MAVAKADAMEKLKPILFFGLVLVSLAFASCAMQPASTTTTTTESPMNRNNANGLASYMH